MCRLTAYVGVHPLPLSDVLLSTPRSLLEQAVHGGEFLPSLPSTERLSGRNHCINLDGFGVAWFRTENKPGPKKQYSDEFVKLSRLNESNLPVDDRIVSYTTLNPPFNDPNFLQLAHYAQSNCLFAHIRASATPAKYNSLANCHPFIFGDVMFMHNGGIAHFSQVKRALLSSLSQRAFELINGTTDSEVIGAMFTDRFFALRHDNPTAGDERNIKTAILQTMQTVILTVEEIVDDPRPHSLNIVVATGSSLVATRYRNAYAEPPSLYFRWDQDNSNVIVSSEPLSFKQSWELIPRNHVLTYHPPSNTLTLDAITLPLQTVTHKPFVQPMHLDNTTDPTEQGIDFLFSPVVPCGVHMNGDCGCTHCISKASKKVLKQQSGSDPSAQEPSDSLKVVKNSSVSATPAEIQGTKPPPAQPASESQQKPQGKQASPTPPLLQTARASSANITLFELVLHSHSGPRHPLFQLSLHRAAAMTACAALLSVAISVFRFKRDVK